MDLPRLRSSAASASSSSPTTHPLSPLPTSCPMGPDSDNELDTPSITATPPPPPPPPRREEGATAAAVESETERENNTDAAAADGAAAGTLDRLSPPPTSHRRDKRAPTVTPRRLAQFFRPRTSTDTRARAHTRALQELQSGGNNVSARLLLDMESGPEDEEEGEEEVEAQEEAQGGDEESPEESLKEGPEEGPEENSAAEATLSRKRSSRDDDDDDDVDERVPKRRMAAAAAASGEDEMPQEDTPSAETVAPPLRRRAGLLSASAESLGEIKDSRAPRRSNSTSSIHAFFGSNRSLTRSLSASQSKGLSLDLNPASLKPKVVTRLGGQPAQRLLRELGLQPAAGRLAGRPLADPRAVIAPFYSDEANSYPVIAYTPAQNSTIPFSLAPCRRMPLIAIGDENGCVRFLDISTDGTRCRLPSQRDSHNDDINDDDDDVWPPTSTYHDDPERRIRSRVKVHDNAIMSLAFSHDDTRLATACGDRNGAILDVATQAMAVSLENAHVGPMRQVTFQPGSAGGNVLATSDRNGCIQIWDLRYSTGAQPQHWSAHDPETRTYTSLRDDDLEHVLPTPIATADRAHARTVEGNTTGASVTALSWFSLAGREHILLSASEANASIRVWDTRFIRHHTHRGHSSAVPLSATRQPASHRWRSFGVTALALSDDAAASRLYAVCRDSTVYAYSAAHLMLGTVPELNSVPARPRRSHVGSVEDPSYVGLGPMYGFRHPQFRTQTFYVKCALRPSAAPGGAAQQMLAVGSSENCAVLFPTDERFVKAALAAPPPPAGATAHPNPAHHHTPSAGGLHSATPTHTPGGSGSFFGGFFSPSMGGDGGGLARHGGSEPDVPIVHCGAALVGGHSREVTHMGWAAGGEGLVSASDDCTVRHWRGDDRERARFLRTCGEGGNHRYGAGWADLGDYDEEDE